MIKERSAGVLIFVRDNNKPIKFLFLFKKYKTEYWDLPKGNIEKGETPIETAEREAKEETGLIGLNFIQDFKKKIKWMYKKEGEFVSKEAIYFLAESKEIKVKISEEHLNYKWLSYDEIKEKVKHKNVIKIVEEAYNYINSSLINFTQTKIL